MSKITRTYEHDIGIGEAMADLICDQLSASNYYTIEYGREHQVDYVNVIAPGDVRFRIVANGMIPHKIILNDSETVLTFWDVSTTKWWSNGHCYTLEELLLHISHTSGYWYDTYGVKNGPLCNV